MRKLPFIAVPAVLLVATLVALDKEPPRPINFDPEPLPAVTNPAQRPRIWFTAADVPELRKRCQTTHRSDFNSILKNINQGGGKPGVFAFDLAFLYQMTGDAQYARRAIEMAENVQRFGWIQPNEQALPYGDWHAGLADPLAVAFDWCFDQMTGDERQAIGKVIREEVAFGPYRTRFHECWWMPAWLSEILALYGAGIDDPLAASQLAAYNRSIHQFIAIADEIHADSAMGDYLYQYRDFMLFPEMWLRATGENLFEKSAFYRTQPWYLLYRILPAGLWMANDGDGPTDEFGGLERSFAPGATIFHFYGWRNNNPYARWLAGHMDGWPHAEWDRAWQAIVCADPRTDERPLNELPPVKLFASNGVAIMRSGWDLGKRSTDVVSAFYLHPGEAHTHFNAGDFAIWRGVDLLAGRGGAYYGTQNAYHHNFFTRTVAHNNVLIYDPGEQSPVPSRFMTANDGGQLRGDPFFYSFSSKLLMGNNPYYFRGKIQTFVDDPRFTYIFADVTPAYDAAKATRVQRAFLWLKPATFIICDRAGSTKPEFAKRWLLQTAAKPSVNESEKVVAGREEAGILESRDSQLVTVRRAASKLVVQKLLPKRAIVRRIGGEGYSYWADGQNWSLPSGAEDRAKERQTLTGANRFWRLEIEPAETTTDVVFLHVLDACAADSAAPSAARVLRRGDAVGASLTRGGVATEVLFYPDGRASVGDRTLGNAVQPLAAYRVPERFLRRAK